MGTDETKEQLIAAIERDEAWLAGVMVAQPAPDCAALESVKHRVRIAVLEAGVALGAPPVLPDAALVRVKQAVRAELAAASTAGTSRTPQWQNWRVALSSLAAAAVLAFALLPFGSVDVPVSAVDHDALEDFVAVVMEAVETSDSTLAVFEAELDAVESSWVSTSEGWFEEEVDDLENEIDNLLSESASLFDV